MIPDLPTDYPQFLTTLKTQIQNARMKAILNVNHELISLYWQVGQGLEQRMTQASWGTKLIEQLSRDLKLEFLDVQGFSPRNLRYMRAFAQAWQDPEILQEVLAKFVQQLAGQINTAILQAMVAKILKASSAIKIEPTLRYPLIPSPSLLGEKGVLWLFCRAGMDSGL